MPGPEWLAAGLAASIGNNGAIVQGRTEPAPAELGRRGVFSRTVSVSSLGPQYETCNIGQGRRATAAAPAAIAGASARAG